MSWASTASTSTTHLDHRQAVDQPPPQPAHAEAQEGLAEGVAGPAGPGWPGPAPGPARSRPRSRAWPRRPGASITRAIIAKSGAMPLMSMPGPQQRLAHEGHDDPEQGRAHEPHHRRPPSPPPRGVTTNTVSLWSKEAAGSISIILEDLVAGDVDAADRADGEAPRRRRGGAGGFLVAADLGDARGDHAVARPSRPRRGPPSPRTKLSARGRRMPSSPEPLELDTQGEVRRRQQLDPGLALVDDRAQAAQVAGLRDHRQPGLARPPAPGSRS